MKSDTATAPVPQAHTMPFRTMIARAICLCLFPAFAMPGVIVLLFGISEWRHDPMIGGGIGPLPFLENASHAETGHVLVTVGVSAIIVGVLALIVYQRLSKKTERQC